MLAAAILTAVLFFIIPIFSTLSAAITHLHVVPCHKYYHLHSSSHEPDGKVRSPGKEYKQLRKLLVPKQVSTIILSSRDMVQARNKPKATQTGGQKGPALRGWLDTAVPFLVVMKNLSAQGSTAASWRWEAL